jgi:hypothetical protein
MDDVLHRLLAESDNGTARRPVTGWCRCATATASSAARTDGGSRIARPGRLDALGEATPMPEHFLAGARDRTDPSYG